MFSGDPARILASAEGAERLGFDGVFVFDHLFPPGQPPDRPSVEAFSMLAAVAARTERVAVGTLVTRAVLRSPGVLAKMAATIDVISGGRTILGIGTGDPIDRPEHRTFGFPDLPVEERRIQLFDTVVALKALFAGRPSPGGGTVPALEGPLLPPPARPGGPPVWLGAQADAVVSMAARIADGWNGWGLHPEAFGAKVRLLRSEAEAAGRSVEASWSGIVLVGEDEAEAERLLAERRAKGMDPPSWSGSVDRFADFVAELAAAGAAWAIMVPAGPPGRRELLAERVLPTR